MYVVGVCVGVYVGELWVLGRVGKVEGCVEGDVLGGPVGGHVVYIHRKSTT